MAIDSRNPIQRQAVALCREIAAYVRSDTSRAQRVASGQEKADQGPSELEIWEAANIVYRLCTLLGRKVPDGIAEVEPLPKRHPLDPDLDLEALLS